MKTSIIFLLASFLLLPFFASAHGVAVINAGTGKVLTLVSSQIRVEVNNQVARVVTTQVFRNDQPNTVPIGYAFPMPALASALQLRWDNGSGWEYAAVQSGPQDPLPGGGGGSSMDPGLAAYLGTNQLQLNPEETVAPEQLITFELTYVELLSYKFNQVSFYYPNDYYEVQTAAVAGGISFEFKLFSGRTITLVDLTSHSATALSNDGHEALVQYDQIPGTPITDFQLTYELASDELGLYSMSTFLPDSLATCDAFGRGFITLIVEPESNDNTAVIQKNFVLVIDHSGSMSGEKMVQARDAGSFIAQHLNAGDRFNIVAFDNTITLFEPALTDYSATSEAEALNFIGTLQAEGSTNISGALTTAVGQFSSLDQGTANIILFFTDGMPTAGITSTAGILQAVEDAVSTAETEIFLFAFGIGDDVNKSLLTQLAQNNSGLADFLGADELEAKITEFFLYVNNPVLLNTQISFDPPVVTQLHPQPLPNLYKGQQLILSGRFTEPVATTVTLSGQAFNAPVQYQYPLNLADSSVTQFSFLPKVWAKTKIENLTTEYYISGDTSLLNTIEDISTCYGVLSQFTSFQVDDGGNTSSLEEIDASTPAEPVTASPNPFRDRVLFQLHRPVQGAHGAHVYIFDAGGRLVRQLYLPGQRIEFWWDGRDESGQRVPAGVYTVVVSDTAGVQAGKVIKI